LKSIEKDLQITNCQSKFFLPGQSANSVQFVILIPTPSQP